MTFELKVPILGFEKIETVEIEKIDDIFMRLKSPEDENISFTLVDPFILREYEFDIPTATQILLGITDSSNILIYNIMVTQSPIENSVINFIAPIVFNTDTQTAAQVILNNPIYGIAEPINAFLSTGTS